MEGGFNGRTNKLVDGCYSFWQGGLFPLLEDLLGADHQQQHEQQQQAGQQHPGAVESGEGHGAGGPPDAALVARLEGLLLHDPEFSALLEGLDPLGPAAAANAWLAEQQAALDAAVEGSLEVEGRHKEAALAAGWEGPAAAALKQEALALLEQAAELQKVGSGWVSGWVGGWANGEQVLLVWVPATRCPCLPVAAGSGRPPPPNPPHT